MTHRVNIHIEKTADDLAQYAAGKLVELLGHAIEMRGRSSLVLSGGGTPRRVYQILGSEPLRSNLDWNRVHLFFGDERMVPPDHADSNYGMAYRELIAKVPIPGENVHRIHGELDPEQAAEEYAMELRLVNKGTVPRFDCVLLGLGEDGHTASLFPGSSVVDEREKSVAALFVQRLNAWRVTLTFPVINNARESVFLVEGGKKASIVQKVIESSAPSKELPATLVRPHDGVVHWMLDVEAATSIRNRTR